jgi:acyl-CoA hydrolase
MGKIVELQFSQIMMPNQANAYGIVHGGVIMKMMDNLAGSVAAKYAKCNVVTARVDEIQFLLPIFVGAYVTCSGRLAYVGNTSMEIIVNVDIEDLHDQADEGNNEHYRAISAFFTMVALNKMGRPKKLPALELKTDEDKRLYEIVKARRDNYKHQKK